MKFLVRLGVCAAALAASVFAQTTPQTSNSSPGITPPAAPPAAPGRGATINLGTGQVVPGSVATNAIAGPVAGRTPSAAGRTVTNALATGPSKITPVQMQNINRLDVELNRLALANRDPAEQQRGVIELLQAAPVGNTRPAPAAVARLGTQLAAVTKSLNLTAPQRRQLAIDLNLALNSADLTPAEAQRVLADARTTLSGGAAANPEGVEQLMAGLTAMVNQLQGNMAQSAPPSVTSGTATPASPPTQAGQSAAGQTGQGSGSGTSTPHPSAPATPPRTEPTPP